MDKTREIYNDMIKGLLEGLEDPDQPADSRPMKMQSLLVLLTGGLTGSEEAAKQLKRLRDSGYRMEVIFSEAGKSVLGNRWLKENGLEDLPVVEKMADGFVALSNCNAVIVPVMTVNTASKVLNGIADNVVTTVIMHALLQGKPVIVAKDACDVSLLAQVRNMKEPLYYATLAANIICLEQYGIEMIPASLLAEKVEELFSPTGIYMKAVPSGTPVGNDNTAEKRETEFTFTGKVLSAADVLLCKADVIRVPQKTIVTPAAADKAAERKIRILVS